MCYPDNLLGEDQELLRQENHMRLLPVWLFAISTSYIFIIFVVPVLQKIGELGSALAIPKCWRVSCSWI